MLDLRSDTVTLPSPAMRTAMAQAELGDDVYGEDPTVNRLEELAAEMVGKEAALLVSSGTMGNLTALLTHGVRGQRVIVGSESHIFHYEAGGASALGGLMYHPVANVPDGTLEPEALSAALGWPEDLHRAPTGLICLENTHNRCGGTVLPAEYLASIHSLAHQHNVLLHLDGARIFNAAVALGTDVRTLTAHVDTVQFCLSKGLAAPVGSILAGPRDVIDRARRVRKMLGGGMRQAGIIAAAGIIALTAMVERLAEDHASAQTLAQGLATIPGIVLDPGRVQTNIVIFALDDTHMQAPQFALALREHQIMMDAMGRQRMRAVTHYGITADDIQQVLKAVQAVMQTFTSHP